MPGPDPIEAYVGRLGGELTGPRRARQDMLAEAGGSLEDAAAHYAEAGMAPHAARELAVCEFGPVEQVAAGYQRELALILASRTARLLMAFVTAQYAASRWGWRWLGGWPHHEPSRTLLSVIRLFQWSQLLIIAAAGVAAFTVGVGVRYIRTPWHFPWLTGAATLILLGLNLLISLGFLLVMPGVVDGLAERIGRPLPGLLVMLSGALLWALPYYYMTLLAVRCLATGSLATPDSKAV